MRDSLSGRGGWRWGSGRWHCVRALQLLREFETLTQWLNLLGSNRILQWFSSETPKSSDFSNILYASFFQEPRTERQLHFTNTHKHSPSIRVHTNSCSRTQMLYISTFLEEPCLYKTDRPLPASQTLRQTHTVRPEWQKRKLQFEPSKMLVSRVGKKVCLIVDMQRCLPTLKPTKQSLHGPVICLRSLTYDSTRNHCLERGIYFVFPGWRHSGWTLSNINFCVHKVELVQPQEEISFYCFSFIRAIMLRPSSHGNNTCEKLKWLSILLFLPN